MTYIVNEDCIKCKHMDCVEVCPVDCFYVGANMLVIHPDECIDCGVCEPECPVDAIKASPTSSRTTSTPPPAKPRAPAASEYATLNGRKGAWKRAPFCVIDLFQMMIVRLGKAVPLTAKVKNR